MIARTVAPVLLVLATSGCESWINKHVSPDSAPPGVSYTPPLPSATSGSSATAGSSGDENGIKFVGSVAAAIEHAEAWRTTYYRAVQESEYLKSATALALIPISAAALYLGITSTSGASRDVITGLGIGGASLFTAANYLSAPTANQIYLAGSKAMGCVVLAARPLLVEEKVFEHLETSLDTIRKQIPVVQAHIRGLKVARQARMKMLANETEFLAQLEAVLSEAEAGIDAAQEALRKGNAYRAQIITAHLTINTVVRNVRDEVSLQLDAQLPTLQSLAQVVSGIGSLAPQISQTSRFAPLRQDFIEGKPKGLDQSLRDPEIKTAKEALKDKAGKLEDEVDKLAEAVAAIADILNDADALEAVLSTINACSVERVPGTFEVEPADPEIEILAGETITFSAIGGSGNYGANLSGPAASGLSLKRELPEEGFGMSFLLTAKSNAEPGEAKIVVRDSSLGNRHEAKIVIKKKTDGQEPPPPPNEEDRGATDRGETDKAAAFNAIEAADGATAEELRKRIQRALCLTSKNPVDGIDDIDGQWGPRTEKAAGLFQEQIDAPAKDGALTKGQVEALIAADSDSIDARCSATVLAVYKSFADEIETQGVPVEGVEGLDVTVSGTSLPADIDGLIVLTLAFSGDGGGDLNEHEKFKKAVESILKFAKSDDHWIGLSQIAVQIEAQ
ncbi:hypothetical protein AAFN88_11655 [Pelagibius sp. CAU 1746]|uniref:hypothetical protein n=1 Tax=Pelagibius sp. CAU 1746 TaxID=3140370 RepID=UPI00325A6569